MDVTSHLNFMQIAIEEAKQSQLQGGIPIGSLLVHNGRVIGRGHNQRIQRKSAIFHAEMDALENAGRQRAEIYQQSTLYTTLSPCSMCSGAILLYKIPCVIIGENQTFLGEEALLKKHGVKVKVLQNEECIAIMRYFIASNKALWNEDIGII